MPLLNTIGFQTITELRGSTCVNSIAELSQLIIDWLPQGKLPPINLDCEASSLAVRSDGSRKLLTDPRCASHRLC